MKKIHISKEMKELIHEIDVSEYNYRKAEDRYQSLASYIGKSELSEYNPEIYLQGSFKLGTAIRPLTSKGSYDIDIVLKFNKLSTSKITQFELKRITGLIIKQYADSNSMENSPVNGNRCWTINYVDESNFHIDVLPSVPNSYNTNSYIYITDKRNPDYKEITNSWEISDPKGYYRWFREISNYQIYKQTIANESKMSVERVPYYRVKTPLQRVVQILKRHAEVMFENNVEFKPSSIIITTLSAIAYPSAASVSDDFTTMIGKIILNIHIGVEYEYGLPCVYNPTNKEEKLTSKWDSNKKYYDSFLLWVNQLRIDFGLDLELTDLERISYIEHGLKINSRKNGLSVPSNFKHHEDPKWEIVNDRGVRIKASVSTSGGDSYRKLDSGVPIGKDQKLRFETIIDKGWNHEIYWQITNTGSDARKMNDLRGGFDSSDLFEGRKLKFESTSYIGKHYVEAYIVKDSICYGKSEPFVVNIVKGMKGFR